MEICFTSGWFHTLGSPPHIVTTRGHSCRPTAWHCDGSKIMDLGCKTTPTNSANVRSNCNDPFFFFRKKERYFCSMFYFVQRLQQTHSSFFYISVNCPFISHSRLRITWSEYQCSSCLENSGKLGGPQKVKSSQAVNSKSTWALQNVGPWGLDMWWCFVRGNGMYLHGQIHQS